MARLTKLGSKVYVIKNLGIHMDGKHSKMISIKSFKSDMFAEINKTVFFTISEAEAKLKELKGVE